MMSHVRPGRPPQPPDREPGPVGLLARLFLTQFLVVLAIAAVITSVFALAGSDNDADEAGTANGAAAQPSASPSPSTQATGTSKSAAPSSSKPVTPSTSAASPAEPDQPKVDVLNQSAGGNAAGRTADQLRAAGWRIGRVDDFRGNVSMTTVYYPPGLTAAAQAVAADMPGEPRVMERFSTISGKRVTVILVD
jgi:hypothetical protein